jgi:hypothetical protein
MYLSNGGNIFVHTKAGTDANTWAKITDVPEPDQEKHFVTLSLGISTLQFSVKKKGAEGMTLVPSINKSIT